MDDSSTWIVFVLIAMLAISALVLGLLEQVRGLRTAPRADESVRSARAIDSISIVAGLIVGVTAAWGQQWGFLAAGAALSSQGAAAFVDTPRLRSGLRFGGFLLLVLALFLMRARAPR